MPSARIDIPVHAPRGPRLLHLAIWLSRQQPEPAKSPTSVRDRSSVLTLAHVREGTTRRLATSLSVAAAAAFVAGGLLLAVGSDQVVPIAVLAAGLGMVLKVLYFHPWRSVGVLLDLGVLSAVVTAWAVSLV